MARIVGTLAELSLRAPDMPRSPGVAEGASSKRTREEEVEDKSQPAGGSQLLIEKPLRIQEVSVRSAGEENFGSVVEVPVPLPGAGGCLLRGVGAVDRCQRILI